MPRLPLRWFVLLIAALIGRPISAATVDRPAHTFAIGAKDFLLDGHPFQIRCGELHFARIPRAYWRDRLRRAKAMGLNAVCAYLFWNFHEQRPGRFDWSGQADAAEFCRMAQEEGLWVILRPGPYACAEWEMGGLPWWLLKDDGIQLRTRDPRFIAAATAWLTEVGRVLGPLQVTHGGPILMVQVENEYGSYGNDAAYVDVIRDAVAAAGFSVPLFTCNPTHDIAAPGPKDLFRVVNFGKDPAKAFAALRQVQPNGPLMCGEFYPGWFDTWGAPHHLGNTSQYLSDLDYMLSHGASFSIYMAHGGTTFGLWSGADRPFKPDTTSYDYDAPIAENGALGEKFAATRALMARYLLPGESLPPVPSVPEVMTLPQITLRESAPLLAGLAAPIRDETPRTMEAYDEAHGLVVYRTTIPAGPASEFAVQAVHDFGWVFLAGKPIGRMNRRSGVFHVAVPERTRPTQLDVVVYALGRVNFGREIHDRKGLLGPATLGSGASAVVVKNWNVFPVALDEPPASLNWNVNGAAAPGPGFWRGSFDVRKPADTFLDVRHWGFGVVWVNGHCLGRFWNIGPTQTMYLPGPWLHSGTNNVVVFDLLGPDSPTLAGLDRPILDQLRPELDFSKTAP